VIPGGRAIARVYSIFRSALFEQPPACDRELHGSGRAKAFTHNVVIWIREDMDSYETPSVRRSDRTRQAPYPFDLYAAHSVTFFRWAFLQVPVSGFKDSFRRVFDLATSH
jgi:hypothetical protein